MASVVAEPDVEDGVVMSFELCNERLVFEIPK